MQKSSTPSQLSKKKNQKTDPSAILCPLYSIPSLQLNVSPSNQKGRNNKSQLKIVEDTSDEKRKLSKMWRGVLLGPIPELCADVGWLPGKKQQLLNSFETARWGGWYDDVKFDLDKCDTFLNFHDVIPFIPRPLKDNARVYLDKLNSDADVELDIPDTEEAMFDIDPELLASVEDALGSYDVSSGSITINIGIPIKRDDFEETGEMYMTKVTLGLFESARLNDYIPEKPGFIFNAGGSIRGMSWCPLGDLNEPQETEYLAVSAVSSHERIRQFRQAYPNEINNVEKPGIIQIWSVTDNRREGYQRRVKHGTGRLVFSLGICVDVGEAISLKWCPKGGVSNSHFTEEKIGILAGCFTDGSISLFAIPEPQSTSRTFGTSEDGRAYIHPREPLLHLALDNTSFRCFDWASHRRIVAGCTDGHIAVYDIETALKNGQKTAKPVLYSLLHRGAVQTVSVVRAPSAHSEEPNLIFTCGYDGNVVLVNLEQVEDALVLCYERGVRTTSAFSSQSGGMIMSTTAGPLDFRQLKDGGFHRSFQILDGSAPSLCIATSDVHPFYSIGASDGSCSVFCLGTQNRRTRLKQLQNTVYKIELNRRTGEVRMIDNLLPLNSQEAAKYGIWEPRIGVQSAAWHPSVRLACLLGSGTGNGIGRIDWVEGWIYERGPGEESSDE